MPAAAHNAMLRCAERGLTLALAVRAADRP
jgi:hypothetical protein